MILTSVVRGAKARITNSSESLLERLPLISASPPTLLVVSESPDLTTQYARWFESRYTIVTATSERDAIDRLAEDVDVVLVDRQMPDCTGKALTSAIRKQKIDCRTVLVTELESDSDITERKFDKHHTKPISKDELYTVIDTLISECRFERAFNPLPRNRDDRRPPITMSEQNLTFDIATRIAETKEFETDSVAPPLQSVVDLGALDRFIRSSDAVRVTFTYEDLEVDVDADGNVSVTDTDRKSRTNH